VTARSTMTIELENYNQWNLPYAKTVYVTQTSVSTPSVQQGSYQLLVDPNSWVTVFFTELDLGGTDSLNYTFYGSEETELTGKWLTMELQFDT